MKFIRKIFEWIILLAIGFLIGLFFGPQIIEELVSTNELEQIETVETPNDSNQTAQFISRPRLTHFLSPFPESINKDTVENNVFALVNELRADLSLQPVERNAVLEEAATIRAIETEESFSHTRPNGQNPFSVLEEEGTIYSYQMVGENLAMATFIEDEEYMSQLIMEGWIDSEGHYQTMITPEYNELGIGVHYDGEILYVTQFFGNKR